MGKLTVNIAEEMAMDLFVNEIDRQRDYLSDLPDDYNYPLFSGKQAVESQRRSGYKDSARAAREIVDNAIEAGAGNIWITFDTIRKPELKKHQRANTVSAVAFIDDGPGMLHQDGQHSMIRYALSWGGGTHFKKPESIGKFGFGLPNSSINQTRRVEVYSKTPGQSFWVRGVLDINEVPAHGLVQIPEPAQAELPEFVKSFLKRTNINLESGTVVVWDKPDRLTWTQASTLAEKLRFDFKVTYRGILEDVSIFVESDKPLRKLDPLFLMPDAEFYVAPNADQPDEGGAWCTFDKELPVKYFRDLETGQQHLEWLDGMEAFTQAEAEIENPPEGIADIRVGTIGVRVARFPLGFVRGEPKYKGTDAYRRFEYRKDRRGMSFVRCGREIDVFDAFPKTERDKASNMGDWPLLQAYAYHWGVEVSFCTELDEAFGIGNDKQTVRPIEDFWRVLAQVHVDVALREEQRYQGTVRKKKDKEEGITEEGHAPAIEAATQASKFTGRRKSVPESTEQEVREVLGKAAAKRAKETGKTLEEAKKAIERESERAKYAVSFFDAPGGVFMRPDWGNGLQIVANINRSHPFFNFYSEIGGKAGLRARNAISLLLLGMAEAEQYADSDEARLVLQNMREHTLNQFLSNSLKVLESLMPMSEDEEQDND
jgi:hypothetical protein